MGKSTSDMARVACSVYGFKNGRGCQFRCNGINQRLWVPTSIVKMPIECRQCGQRIAIEVHLGFHYGSYMAIKGFAGVDSAKDLEGQLSFEVECVRRFGD